MNVSAFDRVTTRLVKVTGYSPQRAGANWRCPAHDDHNPSLSVTNGAGKVALYCHSGCTLDDITTALQLYTTDLFDEALPDARPQVVDRYRYVDEAGDLIFEVVRKTDKTFWQRRPDGAGGWVWHMRPCDPQKCRDHQKLTEPARRVLYRLPRVIDAVASGEDIFVVEGEKDVHALEAAGQVATCNSGGAGKWRPEHADVLAGAKRVIIVADRDEAGRRHARDVERSIEGRVGSVHVVEAKVGKDSADHLAAGLAVDDFVPVADGQFVPPGPTAEADQADQAPGEFFVDWDSFWARDRREPDWLVDDVLARGRGHAIYAMFKSGKSLFMLGIVALLARRGVIVVYLDYEMGEDDLYDRLSDMGYGPDTDFSHLHYAVLPSLPPLDTETGAAALLARVDALRAAQPEAQVAVIIDTTARAVSGEENSADTFRDFYRFTGVALKQRGVTWARLDHAGKDQTKGQRGSSAKGDDVDVVWRLSRTDNGIALKRDASRMGWVPAKVAFREMAEPLRFVRVAEDWPAGTAEVAAILDELGVEASAGERPAGQAMRDAGHHRTQQIVRAAQKYRRKAAEEELG